MKILGVILLVLFVYLISKKSSSKKEEEDRKTLEQVDLRLNKMPEYLALLLKDEFPDFDRQFKERNVRALMHKHAMIWENAKKNGEVAESNLFLNSSEFITLSEDKYKAMIADETAREISIEFRDLARSNPNEYYKKLEILYREANEKLDRTGYKIQR